MSTPCPEPIELGVLAAYRLGELDQAAEQALEEHYFGCDECARRLAWLESLTDSLTEAVRAGRVSSSVADAWVSRAAAQGVRLRSYELLAGQSVQCTVGPDDDFVIVRLRVDPSVAGSVDIENEWTEVNTQRSERRDLKQLFVDPYTHQVVYAFSGDLVRTFTRSRWVMRVRPSHGGESIGPYTMDHTPWASLSNT